jgi:hypothetical protein
MARLPLSSPILTFIFLLIANPTHGKGTKIDIASQSNFHNVSFELFGDLIFYPEKKSNRISKTY